MIWRARAQFNCNENPNVNMTKWFSSFLRLYWKIGAQYSWWKWNIHASTFENHMQTNENWKVNAVSFFRKQSRFLKFNSTFWQRDFLLLSTLSKFWYNLRLMERNWQFSHLIIYYTKCHWPQQNMPELTATVRQTNTDLLAHEANSTEK